MMTFAFAVITVFLFLLAVEGRRDPEIVLGIGAVSFLMFVATVASAFAR